MNAIANLDVPSIIYDANKIPNHSSYLNYGKHWYFPEITNPFADLGKNKAAKAMLKEQFQKQSFYYYNSYKDLPTITIPQDSLYLL